MHNKIIFFSDFWFNKDKSRLWKKCCKNINKGGGGEKEAAATHMKALKFIEQIFEFSTKMLYNKNMIF